MTLRKNTCSIAGMSAQRLEQSCMAEKPSALKIMKAVAQPFPGNLSSLTGGA